MSMIILPKAPAQDLLISSNVFSIIPEKSSYKINDFIRAKHAIRTALRNLYTKSSGVHRYEDILGNGLENITNQLRQAIISCNSFIKHQDDYANHNTLLSTRYFNKLNLALKKGFPSYRRHHEFIIYNDYLIRKSGKVEVETYIGGTTPRVFIKPWNLVRSGIPCYWVRTGSDVRILTDIDYKSPVEQKDSCTIYRCKYYSKKTRNLSDGFYSWNGNSGAYFISDKFGVAQGTLKKRVKQQFMELING